MKLFGKTALVTGAAKRVGRAVAVALSKSGCDLALHYCSSADAAEETAGLCRAQGVHAWLVQADLSDPAAAEALPQRVVQRFGKLHVLVNNAALFERVPAADLDIAAWQRTFAVNVFAPALLSRAAAPFMKQTGEGRIINLGDICSERPWPNHVAYCASKAALESLTRGLAKALAPHIQVNAVAPGIAEFPEGMPEDQREALVDRVPMRRAGTPDEIAAAVRYFAEDARYVTGAVLRVDGGRSISW